MPHRFGPWLHAGVVALVASTICATAAGAETFPERPLTIVVPYAPGGPTDVIARVLGERMGRTLGQTFVTNNLPGASGTIAADHVARSTPDGYTLLLHHTALVAAPSLFLNLRYDTRSAFAPVGLVNTGPLVIVGRKSLPATTAQELFAWIRANGDKVTVGHSGLGSSSHLCSVLLELALGTKMTFVTYRGAAPSMTDLMAGQIDLVCDQSTNSVPQILAGTIKAYAVTSAERNAALPDVPTTAEVGQSSVTFSIWHALYVPKGTPTAIVERLNAALAEAVEDKAVQDKFALVGTVVYPKAMRSVAAHAELFGKEYDRLARLIEAAGIRSGEAK